MFISARDPMIRLSAGGRENMKKNRSWHRMPERACLGDNN